LFTPTVPSGAEGWLNQLTSGIAGTSVGLWESRLPASAQVYSTFYPQLVDKSSTGHNNG